MGQDLRDKPLLLLCMMEYVCDSWSACSHCATSREATLRKKYTQQRYERVTEE